MVIEVLSQKIDKIFGSLQIESHQNVNFEKWLKTLHELLGCSHVSLCISNSAMNHENNYQYPDTNSRIKSNCVQPIECHFELHPISAKLCLFAFETQSETWISLKHFIEKSLEFGIRHYLAIELDRLQSSTFDQMQVGLISIKQGEIHQLNDYALKLVAQKHLSLRADSLLLQNQSLNELLENKPFHTWLAEDTRFQAHLVKSKTEPLKWQNPDSTSWLIIKVLSFRPNVQWLMNLLNLTESEAKVASYACQGFSAKEISRDAHLSTHTVYSYLKSTYKKLGINNQTQLASVIWPRLPL